jgi:hypothetical protein
MKRLVLGTIVAIGAMAVFSSSAVAQQDTTTTGEDIGEVIDKTRFEVRAGGGVTFPLSSDFLETGWHLGGGLRATPSGFPIGFQLDGFYHSFGEKDTEETGVPDELLDSSFLQLTLDGVYSLQTASPTFDPYLLAGVGLYDGDFGLNAGAGTDFAFQSIPLALFIEGRFHLIFGELEDVSLFPVTLGVRIRL